MREIDHLLSARTSICPNVPRPLASLGPLFADLLTRHPLIVPIIPFPNRLRDLDLGLGPDRFLVLRLPLLIPRQSFPAADLKEF